MSDYMAKRVEFEAAIDEVVRKFWADIAPNEGQGLDPLDLAELGDTFPECWVLLIGAAAFKEQAEPDEVTHAVTRFAPAGQSPWTGIGLITDALESWTG